MADLKPKCPNCQTAGVLDLPPDAKPGDAAFCGQCGHWAILDDDITLRRPSMQELAGLRGSPAAQAIEIRHRMVNQLAEILTERMLGPGEIPHQQFRDIVEHTTNRVCKVIKDGAQLFNGNPQQCISLLMKCLDTVFVQLLANLAYGGCELDAKQMATTIADVLVTGAERQEVVEGVEHSKAMREKARREHRQWP